MRTIICGKSASGKDLLRELLVSKGLKPSISYTTRPLRDGEIQGIDYFFITEDEAEQYIDSNIFHGSVKFNGWFYGTSFDSFENDDIFIMTPKAISKLTMKERRDSYIMFLDLDDNTLRERINIRGDMKGDNIDRRFLADKKDFENFTDYDIRISNNDFNQKYYEKKLDTL